MREKVRERSSHYIKRNQTKTNRNPSYKIQYNSAIPASLPISISFLVNLCIFRDVLFSKRIDFPFSSFIPQKPQFNFTFFSRNNSPYFALFLPGLGHFNLCSSFSFALFCYGLARLLRLGLDFSNCLAVFVIQFQVYNGWALGSFYEGCGEVLLISYLVRALAATWICLIHFSNGDCRDDGPRYSSVHWRRHISSGLSQVWGFRRVSSTVASFACHQIAAWLVRSSVQAAEGCLVAAFGYQSFRLVVRISLLRGSWFGGALFILVYLMLMSMVLGHLLEQCSEVCWSTRVRCEPQRSIEVCLSSQFGLHPFLSLCSSFSVALIRYGLVRQVPILLGLSNCLALFDFHLLWCVCGQLWGIHCLRSGGFRVFHRWRREVVRTRFWVQTLRSWRRSVERFLLVLFFKFWSVYALVQSQNSVLRRLIKFLVHWSWNFISLWPSLARGLVARLRGSELQLLAKWWPRPSPMVCWPPRVRCVHQQALSWFGVKLICLANPHLDWYFIIDAINFSLCYGFILEFVLFRYGSCCLITFAEAGVFIYEFKSLSDSFMVCLALYLLVDFVCFLKHSFNNFFKSSGFSIPGNFLGSSLSYEKGVSTRMFLVSDASKPNVGWFIVPRSRNGGIVLLIHVCFRHACFFSIPFGECGKNHSSACLDYLITKAQSACVLLDNLRHWNDFLPMSAGSGKDLFIFTKSIKLAKGTCSENVHSSAFIPFPMSYFIDYFNRNGGPNSFGIFGFFSGMLCNNVASAMQVFIYIHFLNEDFILEYTRL